MRKLHVIALLAAALLMLVAPAQAQRSIRPTERNIPYGTEEQAHRLLDIYLPEDAERPYPVVILLHGSGGSKGDMSPAGVPQMIVPLGYAAVAITYTTRIPDNYADSLCALAWVYANAETYNLDSDRVALYGISFGGLTVAMSAAVDDPAAFMPDCPHTLPEAYELAGVVTHSGVFFSAPVALPAVLGQTPSETARLTANWMPGLTLLADTRQTEWGTLDLEEEIIEAVRQFPMWWIDGSEPPHLIVHGWGDSAVPYGDPMDYARMLVDQRVEVHLLMDRLTGHVVPPRVFDRELATFLGRIFGT